MNRLIPPIIALLLVLSYVAVSPSLALLGSSTVIPSSGTVADPSTGGWLRTSGKWIVDENGRTIALRGANVYRGGGSGGSAPEFFFTHGEDDYRRMSEWGFNVVRLSLFWASVEPSPWVYDETYLSLIDQDIAWAKKYNMYITLAMNQVWFSQYFPAPSYTGYGRGAPIWLVNGYPQTGDAWKTASADFLLGKAPNDGRDPTPENPSMQDRFISMWKHMAERYKDEPTVAAYELYNEPQRGTLTVPEAVIYLYPFYLKAIDAIREVDPEHMIIYEPVCLGINGNLGAKLIDRPNMVFSFHFYAYSDTYSGIASDLEKIFIDNFWNKPSSNPVKNYNIPIMIGEFGTGEGWPNAELWVKDTLYIFNKYGLDEVGWVYWYYQPTKGGFRSLLTNAGEERTQFTIHLKTYAKL